jgi:hypothetical protein
MRNWNCRLCVYLLWLPHTNCGGVTMNIDQPQPGYYRTRQVRGGPWMPVVIRFEVSPDPDFPDNPMDRGPVWSCEVGGEYADAFEIWPYVHQEPISKSEFSYMIAANAWADEYAPLSPEANPRATIDHHTIPSIF